MNGSAYGQGYAYGENLGSTLDPETADTLVESVLYPGDGEDFSLGLSAGYWDAVMRIVREAMGEPR